MVINRALRNEDTKSGDTRLLITIVSRVIACFVDRTRTAQTSFHRGGFAGVLRAKGLFVKNKKRKRNKREKGIGKKKRRDALFEGGTARERTESRFIKRVAASTTPSVARRVSTQSTRLPKGAENESFSSSSLVDDTNFSAIIRETSFVLPILFNHVSRLLKKTREKEREGIPEANSNRNFQFICVTLLVVGFPIASLFSSCAFSGVNDLF